MISPCLTEKINTLKSRIATSPNNRVPIKFYGALSTGLYSGQEIIVKETVTSNVFCDSLGQDSYSPLETIIYRCENPVRLISPQNFLNYEETPVLNNTLLLNVERTLQADSLQTEELNPKWASYVENIFFRISSPYKRTTYTKTLNRGKKVFGFADATFEEEKNQIMLIPRLYGKSKIVCGDSCSQTEMLEDFKNNARYSLIETSIWAAITCMAGTYCATKL